MLTQEGQAHKFKARTIKLDRYRSSIPIRSRKANLSVTGVVALLKSFMKQYAEQFFCEN